MPSLGFLHAEWWRHYFLIIGIWSTAGSVLRLLFWLRRPALPKINFIFAWVDRAALYVFKHAALKAKNPHGKIVCCAAYGMVEILGTAQAIRLLWSMKTKRRK